LSAGRVQSVAVRIVCEREREIQNFVSEEYWSLTAALKGKDSPISFDAKLMKWKGKKVRMANEAETLAIKKPLRPSLLRLKDSQQEKQRHPFPHLSPADFNKMPIENSPFPPKGPCVLPEVI